MYASGIQPRATAPRLSSAWMDGRATLTAEAMNAHIHMAMLLTMRTWARFTELTEDGSSRPASQDFTGISLASSPSL